MKTMLALLLLCSAASAVEVHDNLAKMTTASRDAFAERRFAFDAKVYVTSDYASHDALRAFLRDQTGHAGVSVAVDPVHRMSEVYAGADINLDSGTLSQASARGNPFFRNGDYAGGFGAILDAVSTAQHPAIASSIPIVINSTQAPPVIVNTNQGDSDALTWLVGLILLVSAFAGIIWAIRATRRARQRAAAGLEQRYASRAASGTDAALFKDKPQLAFEMGRAKGQQEASLRSVPTPVVVNNSGNDLATGILIGERLNAPSRYDDPPYRTRTYDPPTPRYAPDPTPAPAPSTDTWSSGSSSDSGSSGGSGWDSGSSGGSSFDSGSGGGSDSGGSGGGSDF